MEPEQINQQPATLESTVKKSNISLPAAIITGAAVIGLAIIFTFGPKGTSPTKQQPISNNGQPTTVPTDIAVVRPDDYIRGNANADVVIIEYSDSDCPFCQQFHSTMQQALADYGQKVAWVYRFFPLISLHPNAGNEAYALSCVGELGGEKAFWPFLDAVMGMTLTPGETSTSTLTSLAVQNGVDRNLFSSCIKSADTKAIIDASVAEAQSIGARGTPFSVAVNQKTGKQVVIPGAVPTEYFKQTIDSLLK